MSRRGFTLIELLTILLVIAVLLALLLPAVQSARGAAVRMNCASNLRQIGQAIANYEATFQFYPTSNFRYRILPQLDQQAVYDLPWQSGQSLTPMNALWFWDVLNTKCPPIFHCPADPARETPNQIDTSNYVASSGVWVPLTGYDGILSLPGFQSELLPGKWTRPRDVLDGLSNTAMCSELLHSDGTHHRLRTAWNTPNSYDDIDEFTQACESIPANPYAYGWHGDRFCLGVPWYAGGYGEGLYNHAAPPNRPSCLNRVQTWIGIWSAASFHRGGVNVLFGDGHVAFISENIDSYVWRDYGSRQGSKFGP